MIYYLQVYRIQCHWSYGTSSQNSTMILYIIFNFLLKNLDEFEKIILVKKNSNSYVEFDNKFENLQD